MEDNKIYQDNEKFILSVNNKKNSNKKNKITSFFTKRHKLKSSVKRSKKFSFFPCFIISLPFIFLFLIIIVIYKSQIKKANTGFSLLSFSKNKTNITNIPSNFINGNESLVNTASENKKGELIFDNISASYNKAIPYIQKNINGELDPININKDSQEVDPLVSGIIPVFNSKNIILRSIRSMQNQDMKNIEIILVNDFSTDGTLQYIEELQKNDSRIKILKNQKNMGTLYSRSIGALLAKGKYIFPLDNGDMILDYDVFSTIYNVAINDIFDIVEFRCVNAPGLYNLKGNRLLNIMFSYHKVNLELRQPELGYFPIQPKNATEGYFIEDNYLWNKCIKTSVYQKGLNLFGEERYKRFMVVHEDLIMIVLLFNIAESFKFIGKYGVLNVPNSGGHSDNQVTINAFEMYILDTLVDFSKDYKENKRIIARYVNELLKRDTFKDTLKNDENKKLFKSILDRIYECKLISDDDKNKIKQSTANLNYTY